MRYASGLAVVAILSSFVLASRAGLKTTLGPADLLLLRFSVAAVIALPIVVRSRSQLPSAPWSIALALTGGLGFATVSYLGLSLAPASHGSALIHGGLPLQTMIINAAMLRRAPARQQLLGCCITIAGIALLLADSFSSDPRALIGDAFLLCACFLWAAYAIISKRTGLPASTVASCIVVTSALLLLLASPWVWPHSHLRSAPMGDILVQAVIQGVLVGVLSVFFYSKASRDLGPQLVASMAATVPAFVTLLAVPLLGESLNRTTALGVLAIVCGAVITARA